MGVERLGGELVCEVEAIVGDDVAEGVVVVRRDDLACAVLAGDDVSVAVVYGEAVAFGAAHEEEAADAAGEFLAARLAGKVWQLYGKNGLPDNRPPLGQPVGDTLRYHIKKGRHSITRWDWRQYYDFADALFHTRTP